MRQVTLTSLLLFLALSGSAQTSQREQFQNANVSYDWVVNRSGQQLRTFITRPKAAPGKVSVIFFVGWLSCDSMEYPDPNTRDGFGIFMRRLIDESGYATVRMGKPGLGESQGDCSKADFNSEMEGWQAAFAALGKYDFIDPDRVFVVGLSNGGGFSPLAVGGHPVRGFVSAGSWGRTWYEHMLELERRRLTAQDKSPAEVNASVKAFADFYNLYLVKGMTPGQVIAQHPEWKSLWYDTPDGQYYCSDRQSGPSRPRPLSGNCRHGPWLHREWEISRRPGAAGYGVDERATALTQPVNFLGVELVTLS